MSETERGTSRKRILAVDDTAIILTRISDILRNDFDVITVNSGARALKYLGQEKPDLILLDIQMTPKNGIDTLRDIRNMEGRADIPVIMLTGVDDKESVLARFKLGIKPFSSDDLLKRIRMVFDPESRTDTELY